ncbi:Uncharacterised protein [Leminorella richardii]|uniref:Lipoprotein-related protein n=1 Tax=Leminorella richardii TaxID=158841 RepID=A0A2X4UII0_9GAMM|nr:YbaY family lipoprotein [Leminorella richardii]SQI38499.1 Uncharacterised protein [Leminorella richardii]
MHFLKVLSGAALAAALVGCSAADQAPTGPQVTGSVAYRERIALPKNANVTVTLADISRADAPARVLSSVTFPAKGKQVPFSFSLPYKPEQLVGAQTVSLFATISVDGKLLYTSTSVNEVLTNGSPAERNVLLERVQP